MGHESSSASRIRPASITCDSFWACSITSVDFELFQRGQHGGAAERRGRSRCRSLRRSACWRTIRPGRPRRRPERRCRGPCPSTTMSGSTPYSREGEQRAGAAEIGLHFVENEDDVVLAAKTLEQLQVFLLRMIRAAAAQIRLGDQAADAAADILSTGRSARPRRAPDRSAARRRWRCRHSSVGKPMKRTRGSRSGSCSLAGDGAGQPFLAVKAVARGQDHVLGRAAGRSAAHSDF